MSTETLEPEVDEFDEFGEPEEELLLGDDTVDLALLALLSKDLKKAAVTLTDTEVRYLVSSYYNFQESRKRAGNQIKAMEKGEKEKPHELTSWFFDNAYLLEKEVARALAVYVDSKYEGIWLKSIMGIGPILSAGLIAHVDYKRCNTVGSLWRFAGVDPTSVWEPGTRRPWNADLKTLCWKIGTSFIYQSGRENDFYGKLYLKRRSEYIVRNEAGEYKERSLRIAEEWKRRGKTKSNSYKVYITGKFLTVISFLWPDGMQSKSSFPIMWRQYMRLIREKNGPSNHMP